MAALLYLFALLWTASLSLASPFLHFNRLGFLSVVPPGLTCRLPVLNRALCPKRRSESPSVDTSIGTATGVEGNGATRYAVKYASAGRWKSSTIQHTWKLPNGASDPSALPLACPQAGLDDSSMSEDCLSMILYVPDSLDPHGKAPTLMWIHGGSYLVGSATGSGLDGSKLAVASSSIVAVIQYRLGGLGFMVPSGKTNLAVEDAIVALQFLQKVLPSFGGDPKKITISGQSSGADMVRALLATDSASALFCYAILQSDPMDYGFLSTATQKTLQKYFNKAISCGSSDTNCLAALSVDTIVNATTDLRDNAASLDASTGSGQPIRPVHDGTLIKHALDSSSSFPKVSKPLLLSTVLNEAALSIYGTFSSAVSTSDYKKLVLATFGKTRANTILNSSFYKVADGSTDTRPQLEAMGTDYIWKCSTWTFAKNWVANGGKAYVGLYTLGASYPGNDGVSICTNSGVVCHQDDIEIVFGTVSNPTSAQAKLVKTMQARYTAFLHNGDPNTSGVSSWPAATSGNANAILLGSSGRAPINACVSTFWGDSVPYDYQVYGI